MDVGSYWIQFLQAVLADEPLRYEAESSFDGPNGSDWTSKAAITFTGGVRAEALFSFDMPYEALYWLTFEGAEVRISNFFRASLGAFKITLDIRYLESGVMEKVAFPSQNYYVNQLSFFRNVVLGRATNLPIGEIEQRVLWMEQCRLAMQTKGQSDRGC
nr:hypothetical protein [Paenibacillus antri]